MTEAAFFVVRVSGRMVRVPQVQAAYMVWPSGWLGVVLWLDSCALMNKLAGMVIANPWYTDTAEPTTACTSQARLPRLLQ